MSVLLSVFKYLALAITSLMAVSSLFFEFTEKVPGSSGRKTLTAPGKWALAVTMLSILVSFGSTVTQDLLDAKRKQQDERKRALLLKELQFSSQVFHRMQVDYEFDQSLNWESSLFLSARLQESVSGVWKRLNDIEIADWSLKKFDSPLPQHTDRSVQ